MTTRVRFFKAADVFEAFPTLGRFAPPPTDDVDPLGYVRARLAARRPLEAIAMLAHTLPRREAVWWARRCVAALLGPAGEDDCARAAEAWVRAPEERHRRAALDLGLANGETRPTTWLALAAGRSGGSVSAPDQPPAPAAPEACAEAVGAALALALAAADPRQIQGWISACLAGGLAFAEGGDMRIVAPAEAPPARQPR